MPVELSKGRTNRGDGVQYELRRFSEADQAGMCLSIARHISGRAQMGDPKVPPIGPRIRAERARREVTIRALARDIGVSPSLISQIETGKSQPSVSTLYAISSALNLPLEDLFDADEFAEPAPSAAAGPQAYATSAPIGPRGWGRTLAPRTASC
jgi:transcriptional regulator with XRE-family HTH domain